MNILIIGSNGILGQDLKTVLNESKHQVSCLELDNIDIRDLKTIENTTNKLNFELIIYSKGYENTINAEKNKQLAYEINALGAKNLATICKQKNCPLIYISSYLVFDGNAPGPYHPENDPEPINEYGKSKLAGERFIQETIDRYYIFRTGKLYGERQDNYIDNLIQKCKNGKDFKAYQDIFYTPTWTISVARAINKLIETYRCKINYGIYHCSNSGKCSDYELINEILLNLGLYNKTFPLSYNDEKPEIPLPINGVLECSKTPGMIIHWRDALKKYFQLKNHLELYI